MPERGAGGFMNIQTLKRFHAIAIVVLALAPISAGEDGGEEKPQVTPGIVPLDDVPPGTLKVHVTQGDETVALKTFLDAHAKHKQGATVAARRGYMAFLGMPGRHLLPERYRVMAKARLEAMDRAADRAFEAAAQLYKKDGKAGLAALTEVAEKFKGLPSATRANGIVQSDELKRGIARAQALAKTDRKNAVKTLEPIIRRCADAVYLYKAKSLLLEWGGPDLRTPEERLDGSNDDDEIDEGDDDDDGEPVIEVGDG